MPLCCSVIVDVSPTGVCLNMIKGTVIEVEEAETDRAVPTGQIKSDTSVFMPLSLCLKIEEVEAFTRHTNLSCATQVLKNEGTVTAAPNFSPSGDAAVLDKAIKTKGELKTCTEKLWSVCEHALCLYCVFPLDLKG